jgi:tetratricopeptide (TPR) repeat protein
VAEAAGMRKIPALRRLGHLERSHRLVRSAGDEFVFDHHQIQEALHSAISPPLRKEYHAALGRALLNQHPEPDGRAAVKVCEHFLRGERGPEALRHLDAALDHLDSRYRYEQVVAMADQALAMEGLLTGRRRAEILLRKATRLGYLGRRDVEHSALQDVLALAKEAGDKDLRSRAHRALGSNHLSQSRLEAAQEDIRRARDLAREIGDRKGEAKDLGGMGLAFAYLGRYEEALVHHDHALAISQELGDRRGEGAAAGNKGLVLHYLGRTEEAIEHYERSLAIAGELGARDIEVTSRGNLGAIHGSVGNHEEARTQFERCLAIAVELGDRKGEGAAAGNLGIVSQNLGFIGEARARFEQGLGVAREVGARLSEGIALANLGPLHARLGAFDRGWEKLSCALAIFRDIGARREEGYALHGMAVVAESGGDYEEAGRFCEQALALRREIHYERGVTSTQSLLGSIRLAEGRSDEGRELLEQVLAAEADGPSPGAAAFASALLAFHFGGNPAAALKVLEGEDSSLGCESRMELCFLLWRATEDTTHLCEAYRLLRKLCANATEEYRETMIQNVPLHRDIMAAWEEHGADGVP